MRIRDQPGVQDIGNTAELITANKNLFQAISAT